MADGKIYSADYFLRGRESGLSLYSDYRWLESLTPPMCRQIVWQLEIDGDDTVCDFGCARGYIVRALRTMGIRAFGMDVSKWAIDNCDPLVKNYLQFIEGDSFARLTKKFDWVWAKDVLEHIPDEELDKTIDALCDHARKGVFVVVPLSAADGQPYVVPEYEQDVTHVQRLTLGSWMKRLQRNGFCTSGCYRMDGVKENYYREGWEEANGFITMRRDVQL